VSARGYTGTVSSPYRDENESLRAEVERLRTQLARRRTSLWAGLVLVAVDFGAVMVLRPWLNGASDVRFWSALALIVAIAVSATWSVARR
jgi:hypothetical protein